MAARPTLRKLAKGFSALAALWFVYAWLASASHLNVRNATIERLQSEPQSIHFPWRDEKRTESVRYRITGSIAAPRAKGPRIFHLTPDDCLDSLLVGGRPVDLRSIRGICDWREGFTIDLASLSLREGKNAFPGGAPESLRADGLSDHRAERDRHRRRRARRAA